MLNNPEALIQEKRASGDLRMIDPTAVVINSDIGEWVYLGPDTMIIDSTFGDYSYTDETMIIYTDVGKFCSIASHVAINPGNHPMWRVTQHHMTYRRRQYGFGEDDQEFFQWRKDHRCSIGHDVWIGHGVSIMAGVSIGTGSVVGSGAVVTKNVPPYTIMAGIPARPIRKRFPEDVIAKLLKSEWWNWDRETLEARFQDLLDLETFLKKYCAD